MDKLEDICKKSTEINNKQSRLEQRLNELKQSDEFLDSKCDDQQVQLTKATKENNNLAKENLLVNKKHGKGKKKELTSI